MKRLVSMLAFAVFFSRSALPLPQSGLVIENVTLIDGTGRAPIPGVSILIEDNRISRVIRGGVGVPAGASRIDGKGKYAIPGLMDVHIHLHGGRLGPHLEADENAPLNEEAALSALHSYLYAGVTAVYDAGSDPEFFYPFREKERAGEIVSPRVFGSGFAISAPGGHAAPVPVTVEDWAKDRHKVDEVLAWKPDLLKITQDEHGWNTRPYGNYMPVELLERVIRYAHEHGVRTCIHTSNELRTWEAIYAGVDTLAHPVIQGPVSEKYLNMMKVKKVPQVSTLTIGDQYQRLIDQPEFLDQPFYRAVLDPREILRLKTEEREKQARRRWGGWMRVMNPVAQENLRKLNEVGGIVALGTDQDMGPAVHRELELLVEGGVSPLDAIKIGTLNAAIFLGKENELGTIEEGKLADIVILNADPTADIDNAKLIETVIKDGRIIDRNALRLPGLNGGTDESLAAR